MSEPEEGAATCKVVLIGESGVGKTSIISRYTNNTFKSQLMSTPGANFVTKNIILEDENQSIKFEIWDTAGQERYRALAKVFYKNAAVCVLVYDITRKTSFNELKNYWYKEIKENAQKDEREVTNDIVNEWCESNNIKMFFETSAKNGINIDNIFSEAAKVLLEQHKKIKNKMQSTESMKNVLLDNKLFNKIKNKESMVSEGDMSTNQIRRRRGR